MGGFSSGIGSAVGAVTGVLGGGFGGDAASTGQTTDNGIAVGDYVCLLPINGGQKFIVLGKLVYGTDLESMMAAAAEESSGGSSGGLDIGTISSIAGGFE